MSWHREQALIVDGDSQARAATAAVLSAAGYQCVEHEEGEAAVASLHGIERGLVVTELELPGNSGPQLLASARQRHPQVGVVIVSGRNDAASAVEAMQAGALDYLVKPVSETDLSRRLRLAIERRQLQLQHDEYHRELEQRVIQRSRELESTHEQILFTLGEAVAARHTETQTHTQRVTHLSMRLAKTLGLRGSDLTGLEWGAALHDVGKIGIPDAILLKPDPLTKDEWELMKQHCEIGHRMLRGFSFLREALAVVLHHHERFDGDGYPYGLAGEPIPFTARIFAVVDAYDAMTSERPYRPPVDPEQAKRELARCAAAQFDPDVVDAFLGMGETPGQRSTFAYASA